MLISSSESASQRAPLVLKYYPSLCSKLFWILHLSSKVSAILIFKYGSFLEVPSNALHFLLDISTVVCHRHFKFNTSISTSIIPTIFISKPTIITTSTQLPTLEILLPSPSAQTFKDSCSPFSLPFP